MYKEYPILIWPDMRLRKISLPIKYIDHKIINLINKMIIIMTKLKNVAGLAAPQIGVHLRLIILKIPVIHKKNILNKFIILINPFIISYEKEIIWNEGCLSIPNETGNVKRNKKIIITYKKINNTKAFFTSENYLAVCLQHEIDHLNGKLWIDYQSYIIQKLIKDKMILLKKNNSI